VNGWWKGVSVVTSRRSNPPASPDHITLEVLVAVKKKRAAEEVAWVKVSA
jgi:hypothetical protein